MAGKSTYMRQVALITLMAQCGSFVPATFARLGVVDKIFTRIGASDDLSMGQSTFMVEMMEVATILKEATQNMRLEEELLHMMDYQLRGRLQNICQIKKSVGQKHYLQPITMNL